MKEPKFDIVLAERATPFEGLPSDPWRLPPQSISGNIAVSRLRKGLGRGTPEKARNQSRGACDMFPCGLEMRNGKWSTNNFCFLRGSQNNGGKALGLQSPESCHTLKWRNLFRGSPFSGCCLQQKSEPSFFYGGSPPLDKFTYIRAISCYFLQNQHHLERILLLRDPREFLARALDSWFPGFPRHLEATPSMGPRVTRNRLFARERVCARLLFACLFVCLLVCLSAGLFEGSCSPWFNGKTQRKGHFVCFQISIYPNLLLVFQLVRRTKAFSAQVPRGRNST